MLKKYGAGFLLLVCALALAQSTPPPDHLIAVRTGRLFDGREMLAAQLRKQPSLWDGRSGRVLWKRGSFTELIAVAGDPIADITELEPVKFVMKGGQVFRNELK